MLSVLIPTYNYKVVSLVKSLHKQLKYHDYPFEIICFDNGSDSEIISFNKEVNELKYCFYKALKKNDGRSKIRNLLAEKAKFNWLLFLDADVLPVSKNFIQTYYQSIQKNNINVAFGGIKYNERPTKDKMLRWVYGKSREEISLEKRKNNPEKHFTAANFLINKKLFNKFKFDETLIEYGYEDTLFAFKLKNKKIQITQIDNPVYHLGIDKSEVFLIKTRESVQNLFQLYNQKKIKSKDFKILKIFIIIKNVKIAGLVANGFKKYRKLMEKNLLSDNPSLLIYDLYKLGYLCFIRLK